MKNSTSFYSKAELKKLGLKSVGKNVLISRYSRIYNAGDISIGNNVRIDDYCILTGHIEIGSFVHIAAFCGLFGSKGIILKNFSGLSSRVMIYSASDDYSGEYLTNPTVPLDYKKLIEGEVVLNKHVIIGAACIILPAVVVGDGVAVGSMSLVNKNLDPWTIYAGIPVKRLKDRCRNIVELESKLNSMISKNK